MPLAPRWIVMPVSNRQHLTYCSVTCTLARYLAHRVNIYRPEPTQSYHVQPLASPQEVDNSMEEVGGPPQPNDADEVGLKWLAS